jgi:hypothetical protein
MLPDTPANRKKLQTVMNKIETEIALGKFDYARYFPNSPMLNRLTAKRSQSRTVQSSCEALSNIQQPLEHAEVNLRQLIQFINANMLVLRRGAIRNHDNISNVVRSPEHGQLIARYEQDLGLVWILKKVFKDYCIRGGYNYTRVVDELTHQKVITNKNDRKVLGGGTELAKGQAWCLTVDMLHPEISGTIATISKPAADVLPFARTKVLQPATATV